MSRSLPHLHPRAGLCLVLAIGSPVTGQSAQTAPAPTASAPANAPLIDLTVVGPGRLRAAFLATNLGTLLGSEENEPAWRALFSAIGKAWQLDAAAQDGAAFARLQQLIAGYRGSMRLRLLPILSPAQEIVDVGGMLELLPDGQTDLKTMRDGLHRIARGPSQGDGKSEGGHPVTVGDATFHTVTGTWITAPALHEGRIVAFFGRDLKATVRTALPQLSPLVGSEGTRAAANAAPLHLHVDLQRCLDYFGGSQLDIFESLLRFRDLGSLDVRIRARGPYASAEISITTTKEFGVILDELFPIDGELPDLQSLPVGRDSYVSMFSFDYQRLWDRLEQVREIMLSPKSIKESFLDNLKPGLTVLGKVWENPTLIFSIKNPAAESGFHEMMSGQERSRTDTKHKDLTIRSQGTTAHSAVLNNRLFVNSGADGVTELQAVLDGAVAAMHPKAAKTTSRPGLRKLLQTRKLTPGAINGMGVLPAEDLHQSVVMSLVSNAMGFARRKLFRSRFSLERKLKDLSSHFTDHRLGGITWFSSRTPRTIHLRFFW